jgi:hypothetical protein
LYCFCEQEERAKLAVELKRMVARAHEEKTRLEDQLAKCLKETDVLCQQMNEISDHQVSKMGFIPTQNRIILITVLCCAFPSMPKIFRRLAINDNDIKI